MDVSAPQICFAPMEGLTTYILRNAHHAHFAGIDDYYTPFLSANRTLAFKRKELRDILPENNEGIPLIPQVLGNKADEVCHAVRTVADHGYRVINFNLGCPMPQVARRGKGSGFLKDPDSLDRFFEEVFAELERSAPAVTLTVKTRIGTVDPAEAEELIKIYNRYPIRLLIIHPRLMKDLYNNCPDMDAFEKMAQESVHPVCYNGDIYSVGDYERLAARFPGISGVMLGRGLLRNPALAREIKGGKAASPGEIQAYHDEIWKAYLALFPDARQAVAKMKGFWSYQGELFPEKKKELKKIKKSVAAQQYEEAAAAMWH